MKKLIGVLLGLAILATSTVKAEVRSDQLDAQFRLNQASAQALADAQLGDRISYGLEHVQTGILDYSVVGGAQSTIRLKDKNGYNVTLPKGAIVRNCILDVITAPTSTTTAATISFGTGNATNATTDLKAATAIGSYTGLVACVPVGSAATAVKLTADSTPSATIATADLTSVKIIVHMMYELSDPN
jgi:hypothetical protein